MLFPLVPLLAILALAYFVFILLAFAAAIVAAILRDWKLAVIFGAPLIVTVGLLVADALMEVP